MLRSDNPSVKNQKIFDSSLYTREPWALPRQWGKMEIVERYDDMWFECNISGIHVKLQINDYKPTNKDNWDSEWCKCNFSFVSEDWLNYHKENDEVLLSGEVKELAEALTGLLDNKFSEEMEIACMEPDFIFRLYPQTDLRNDPKYTYIRPGCEIQDISLEWKIYFWNHGLTDNYLTITLDRKEITGLRDYLASVIG